MNDDMWIYVCVIGIVIFFLILGVTSEWKKSHDVVIAQENRCTATCDQIGYEAKEYKASTNECVCQKGSVTQILGTH